MSELGEEVLCFGVGGADEVPGCDAGDIFVFIEGE